MAVELEEREGLWKAVPDEDSAPASSQTTIDDGSAEEDLEEELDDVEAEGGRAGGITTLAPQGFEDLQPVVIRHGGGGTSVLDDILKQGEKQLAKRALKEEAEDLLKKEAENQVEKSLFRKSVEWLVEKTGWETGKKILQKVGWRTATEVVAETGETAIAEGTGAAVTEGVATAATTTGAVAAAPVVITTAAVVSTVAVGYAVHENHQAQSALDEQTRTFSQPLINPNYKGLQAHKSLEGTLIKLAPELDGASALSKDLHLIGTDAIGDDHGHVLNMTLQTNRDHVKAVLEQKIAEQQKIIDANRSAWTNWIPDAVYLGGDRERANAASRVQAPYIAALADLDAYEKDLAANQPAAKQSAPGSSTPQTTLAPSAPVPTARPDSRNIESLNQATSRTFTAGDSLCAGISGCIPDAVNLAVVGSHVTTQGGLKGALQQVDEITERAHRGDKLLFLTGRNDLDVVDSPARQAAYQANLERIARQLKFMQDQGIEVTWLMPVAGGDKNDADILKMAALQQKVADKYGVHTKSVDGEYARGADGVHLKDYHKLAHDAVAGSNIKVGPQNKKPQGPASTNAGNSPQSNYSNMTPTAATTAREQQALAYYMSEGWTREQAAAIVGNQTRESSQNPSIQGDKDKVTGVMHAYGIGQWRDDSGRQEDFKRFIGHDIHQATFEEELRFTNYELRQGKYKKIGEQLSKMTTIEDATHLLRKNYEAPADKLGQEDGIRTTYARRVYDASLSGSALAANNRHSQANRNNLPSGTEVAAIPVHPVPGNGKTHAPQEEAHPAS